MWIPITEDDPESANNPLAADLVNEMAAVFIDDGDPHRLVRLLRNPNGTDSLVLAAMREKFRDGVIAGSGGGAAVLSSGPIAISGTSYSCLVHGSQLHVEHATRRRRQVASSKKRRKPKVVKEPKAVKEPKRKVTRVEPVPDRADLFPGCLYVQSLGFLPSWMVEPRFNNQHFHGRMIRLLGDTRGGEGSLSRGIGIDREMALAIYRVGSDNEFAEVLGNKGGVTLINATAAQYQASATNLNISNVFLTFLSEDDKIILNTDEVLPASWKADLHGEEWHVLAQSSGDIFHQQVAHVAADHALHRSFNDVANRLFDSALSEQIESSTWSKGSPSERQFVVAMNRRRANAFHSDSPTTDEHVISYAHLRVDIFDQQLPIA